MGALTYSTQEVQAKLDSIDQIDAKFGTYPRPNLLDNGFFQVWQRYPDGTYTGVPSKIYIPDRFKIQSSNGGISSTIKKLSPLGIYNESGPNCAMDYFLEKQADYNGKTLTLSLLRESSGGAITLESGTLTPSGLDTTNGILHYFSYNGYSSLRWINTGDKIYAVKLELGDTQTLAHQKNGVWVLNEIPNYQQEQEKCQRYQLELVPPGNSAIGCVGGGTPTSTTQCYVFVPTPTELRTVPTLTYAGTWKLVREGTAPASGAAVSAMSVVNRSANGVTLQITSSGLSTSYRYDLWYTAADTTNKLLLSANL